MSTSDDTDVPAESAAAPTPPRRRKRRGLRVLAVLLVLILAAGVGAFSMVGRPVDAPDWVRERIEARIAEALPGIDVRFGNMSLLVQRTGLTRVILWDVDIRNARGEQVAQLSDIEAGFAPTSLLQGQLVLREAQISGAFVTLQRDEAGKFGLALGDVFADGTEVPDLAAIIARIDEVFADPRLARLDVFEADALTLRYEDQRARRGWTADGGRLRLERTEGALHLLGDVALLGGGSGVATLEVDAYSPVGSTTLDFGLQLSDLSAADIATQSPALAWLDALDAPISGSLRSGLDADGALASLEATLQIGAGALQPNRATRPVPFDAAQTVFRYTPKNGVLAFDDITVRSPMGQISAQGTAQLDGVDTGWPAGLTAQFKLSDMKLAEGDLLDRNLEVTDADVAFQLALEPFQIQLGEMRVHDPQFPLHAKGTVRAGNDGWHLALDAFATTTTHAQVMSYWPADFRPFTRNWVNTNVKEGRLHDIAFAMRAGPDVAPFTFLDFLFSDGRIAYNPRLPELVKAAGRITIDGPRLGIRVDRAKVDVGRGEGVDISGSEFVVPNLMLDAPIGELRLKARGSVQDGLAYIDNDAWRLMRKAGYDSTLASGQVDLTGKIVLPLIEGLDLPDVDLSLNGVLTGVKSSKIVPNRTLTADRLTLTASNRELRLKGDVELSGIPASGEWIQPLQSGNGTVTAKVQMSARALDEIGVGLPRGTVQGSGPAQLEIALAPRGQAPRFTLTSKLAGLGLTVPPLGWSLPRNRTGSLEVAGSLGAPVQIDRIALSGNGLRANGKVELRPNGDLDALTIERLQIDDWLDVTGRLRGRGPGQSPAVEVASGQLDMRGSTLGEGAVAGGSGGTPAGVPIAANLSRVQITDNIVLRNFRGNFDTTGGLRGRFDATVGGKARIEGHVVPKVDGRSGFKITGPDAGDILRAAGILRTVRNGTFDLQLKPVRGKPGTFDGSLAIEGTRLRDAPAIGALLDAVSIVGLIDQLNGPGIFFSEVEARFRLSPNRLVLTRSSAVGPSMGISMDGYYDMNSGRMDMQGVVSPIYIVNGIGRLIARKGEGLIGFNFDVRGSIDAPKVGVNPLSVFTPGMFRDIFRRPVPKLSQ